MYRRNFFKFAFVCSAFQMLFGLPIMATDVPENSDVKSVDSQYVEKKESSDSSNVKNEALEKIDSNEEDLLDDRDLVEISVLPGEGQSIKEVKIQISFDSFDSKDSKNAEVESLITPVVSKPLNVLDESLIQFMKNSIQEKKNAIVSMYGSLRNSLNKMYLQSNSKEKELLDFLKSCELTMRIVTDGDQKTLQMDLKSPIPVNETVLLEKTSLDKTNDRFIEVNLKNC